MNKTYTPPNYIINMNVSQISKSLGLKEVRFKFDTDGTKVIT